MDMKIFDSYFKSNKPSGKHQGKVVIQRNVEALQDGECPCCHGSWPSPDATQCNGCGYELDEEKEDEL